jgi:hypothetical protein
MEQILINLIAGALGGVGTGKSSPTFDLGMIGNIVSGLVWRRGARPDRHVIVTVGHGRGAGGQSERWRHYLTGDRRWRRWGDTHGDHWSN